MSDFTQEFKHLIAKNNIGVSFPPGWKKIIEQFFEDMDAYVKRSKSNVKIVQMKTKFGGLRIYMTGGDPYINNLIRAAEAAADRTCEECGAEGEMKPINGWMATLCETHRQEAIERRRL